jgi:hypothetical protein
VEGRDANKNPKFSVLCLFIASGRAPCSPSFFLDSVGDHRVLTRWYQSPSSSDHSGLPISFPLYQDGGSTPSKRARSGGARNHVPQAEIPSFQSFAPLIP